MEEAGREGRGENTGLLTSFRKLVFIRSPFVLQVFIKDLSCATHCAICWGYNDEKNRHCPCPYGSHQQAECELVKRESLGGCKEKQQKGHFFECLYFS